MLWSTWLILALLFFCLEMAQLSERSFGKAIPFSVWGLLLKISYQNASYKEDGEQKRSDKLVRREELGESLNKGKWKVSVQEVSHLFSQR